MPIQTYDTHTLLGVVRTLKPSAQFWLQLAFPRTQNFSDKFIDFDVVDRGRRLAPFVAPTVAGKPMLQEGYSTRRFTPAYIKPKDSVDPNRVMKRMAGEAYTGTLSPEQRRQAIITEILSEHRMAIERRWEVMAAEALIDGQVTVSGEGYPTTVIQFGRNAGHAVALTGGNQWGQVGIKPLADIETWSTTVFQNSGYPVTDVVLGLDAWAVLRADAEVASLLDKSVQANPATNVRLDIGPGAGTPVQYRGSDGHRRYWTYNDFYESETGSPVSIMDQKTVLLLNPAGVEGVRAFGAILDPQAGYQSVDMYPKSWIENDPPAEFLMMQSAPLMIPTRPNATFKAKVLV